MTTCIETIRLQPKPVTEHLVKGHGLIREHRCELFTRALEDIDPGSTPQSHLRAGSQKERIST